MTCWQQRNWPSLSEDGRVQQLKLIKLNGLIAFNILISADSMSNTMRYLFQSMSAFLSITSKCQKANTRCVLCVFRRAALLTWQV